MKHSRFIFEFHQTINIDSWSIVNDDVMGGMSQAKIYINNEGYGVYKGNVSLENNGGFSIVRYRFDTLNTNMFSKIMIKIKGDGKRYQFRIKHKITDNEAYVGYFKTTKSWQTVEFNLTDLYPTFRGKKLNQSNYNHTSIQEIAFLIANKKQERFKLEIANISIE